MIELDWGPRRPNPEEPSFGPYNEKGLEIGGGPHPLRLMCKQFDLHDWTEEVKKTLPWSLEYDIGDAHKLPYADKSFGYVFASNLLEHFPASETQSVLEEWTRVLKVGGILELVVPDFMGILRDFFDSKVSWQDTAERILGSQDYDGNRHYRAFTVNEFACEIDKISTLRLVQLSNSHAGGGIYAICERVDL